jgi:2-polyprenyl-6-methoxyphenol hydroxylase-like FAD-dependent oxidoreductase
MGELGERAIVIGGSIAGLMAARVLSHHFEKVLIVERDPIGNGATSHKSVPQGYHAHGLMLGGLRVASRLYPGFEDKLQMLGAIKVRAGEEFVILTPAGRSYSFGGAVKEPRYLGLDFYQQSRGLLEDCFRRCTLETPNIEFRAECAVGGLDCREGMVRGAFCADDAISLQADLVVDAGGRGSHAPRWLRDLGFTAPHETSIGVDFAYSTAKFQIPGYSARERGFYAIGPGPAYPRAAFLGENDGGWILSVGGRFGDYPPVDDDGFRSFLKGLHAPQIYEMISDAERISEIRHYRFPTSLLRHYELLSEFPERFITIGDSIASFNPLYAQGMTSAALQAEVLADLLGEGPTRTSSLTGLPRAFFARAAKVVTTPWMMAAHSDFAYPQTKGEKPPGLNDNDEYLAVVEGLSADDIEIQKLVWEVFGLARPMSDLWEESVRSRALAEMKRRSAE